jgi:hypothetical protein
MCPSENFDVVVVGGGSAGVAAAVSAAELGSHTLLLERGRFLGGNVAHAFVHTICGLYCAASEGAARILNPGMPGRLAAGLRAAGVAGEVERAGRVYVLPIEPPRYAAFLAELCERTTGLEVRTESELVGVERSAEKRRRWGLRTRNREGDVSGLAAGWLLDTTGDANAAALAGASLEVPGSDVLQLPSFIFRMAGVDHTACVGFARLHLTHAVAGAVAHGDLPAGCESLLVRPGSESGEVYVTLNLPRPAGAAYAPLDEARLAAWAALAREAAERIAEFLRSTRPAFEKSRICAWPERIGVRESRRIPGLRELRGDDVLSGRSDPDEVARSSWPIELWHDHRRAHFEYPEAACSIPLGSLVSRFDPQLGMAGRCLSANQEALGALRVIGTALATGEAIGVAAALAANAGVALDAIAAGDVRQQILERADREIAS